MGCFLDQETSQSVSIWKWLLTNGRWENSVSVSMYLPNPSTMSRMWHKVNFYSELVEKFINWLILPWNITKWGLFFNSLCSSSHTFLWVLQYIDLISKKRLSTADMSSYELFDLPSYIYIAQLAGAVEYTDCTSAER